MAKQKQDDQFEHIYSSYVKIWDVALKTCQKRWMIGRSGERGSGISVLVARYDDNTYEKKKKKMFPKFEKIFSVIPTLYVKVLNIKYYLTLVNKFF